MVTPVTVSDLATSDHRKHANNISPSRVRKQPGSPHPSTSPPLCEKSSAAVVDVLILLLVVGACGFLFTPYFGYLFKLAAEVLPLTFLFIGEVVYQAPVAYISGAILMFIIVIGGCELHQYKSRRCDNPHCRGLKKAVEFDIQLESENCAKSSSVPTSKHPHPWKGSADLSEERKELEAELRRMAPPNGKAVLTFRSKCGCPAARMEVWGSKKPRKMKS